MKVAVTGANGHLGANVVRALLDAGCEVIAVVREGADCRGIDGLELDLRQAEVTGTIGLRQAFAGVSHVINLAAVVSIDGGQGGLVSSTNVDGPRAVAAASLAAGVERLVHVSCIQAFLLDPDMASFDEAAERSDKSGFPYDRSKALGEQAIREELAGRMDVVILNPTAMIGPHDHGRSFHGRLLRLLFDGRLPVVVSGGLDWIDVRDVASACVAALTRGRPGESHILSGTYATVAQIAGYCSELADLKPPAMALPAWVAAMGLPFLIPWTRLTGRPPLFTGELLTALKYANRNVSSARAARELGFAARPLEETLTDCWRWYGEV